jgi:hypothetical protein
MPCVQARAIASRIEWTSSCSGRVPSGVEDRYAIDESELGVVQVGHSRISNALSIRLQHDLPRDAVQVARRGHVHGPRAGGIALGMAHPRFAHFAEAADFVRCALAEQPDFLAAVQPMTQSRNHWYSLELARVVQHQFVLGNMIDTHAYRCG